MFLTRKAIDVFPVKGFLPLRKFFLAEHVAVAGFAPAKYPAANREHDRGSPPSTRRSRTAVGSSLKSRNATAASPASRSPRARCQLRWLYNKPLRG